MSLQAAPVPAATGAVDENLKEKYQNSQPEGKASFRDYLVRGNARCQFDLRLTEMHAKRIFSYARKGDLLLLVLASAASIGSGIVSITVNVVSIRWLTLSSDNALDDHSFRQFRGKFQ